MKNNACYRGTREQDEDDSLSAPYAMNVIYYRLPYNFWFKILGSEMRPKIGWIQWIVYMYMEDIIH